ncbi:hypothetical protein A4H97_21645 [Niastella yeongjuensis]|uniref:Uncharacterized protein n=1 Tax=Niastella yeongjuensis TaxID=354355 RepID=A0A1V9F8M9_9BACT|nr:DUF6263 family protein [Niastella yeongjuensis]OQP54576.1 hypothetical protein A4H97_21645 [Niastella yeongjuensis]SEN99450.1 hypothetical protein SAMN05660816_01842 [Niastella yeongjuensis]
MLFKSIFVPKTSYLLGILVLGLACNTPSGHGKVRKDKGQGMIGGATGSDNNDDALSLQLNLQPGSKYYYTINNEYDIALEAGGKSINNKNKSDVSLTYDIQKDSAGNYLLQMHYDKIHLYTKAGDKESEMDADNANATFDPVEKMLGVLKSTNITAVISSAGKIKDITGYKELGDKIIAGLNITDLQARNMALEKWDKVIGEGLIKKNIDQAFHLFPDSAIEVGDTWKLQSQQKGEVPLNETSKYKLKDVDDGIAYISSEGQIESDKTEAKVMGYPVTGNLQGSQSGEYEVDAKTGMLLKNKVTAKVEGSFLMMGREIPVTIKTEVKMAGKKII